MRLELGRHLEPYDLRLTELIPEGGETEPSAPPLLQTMASPPPVVSARTSAPEKVCASVEYAPPVFSACSGRAGYAGTDFVLQPDGTLLCPASKPLYPQKRTLQANGSFRLSYAARISHCRACPLRSACQGSDKIPRSARTVSAICRPLVVSGSALALAESVDEPTASVSACAENAPTLSRESIPPPPPSRDTDREPPSMSAPKMPTGPLGYGPPVFSARSAHAGFVGTDFSFQPDGTVLCPAKHSLSLLEERPLKSGSIRLVYAARISHCRDCPLRSACQGPGNSPVRGRRVHALCHPLPVPVVRAETEPTPVPVNVQTSLEPPSVPSGEIEPTPALTASVPTATEPTSAPVHVAPMEMEPVSPAGNVSTPLVSASPPVPMMEMEPWPPPVDGNVGSASTQVVSMEMEPVPPAGNVPTPLVSTSASVHVVPLETLPTPAPTDLNVPTAPQPTSPPGEAASGPACASPRSSPLLWEDWSASHIRQQWMKRLRTETVHLTIGPPAEPKPEPSPLVRTRAQRAHWRLSWGERFARNARREDSPALIITLHGLPASFAKTVALALVA